MSPRCLVGLTAPHPSTGDIMKKVSYFKGPLGPHARFSRGRYPRVHEQFLKLDLHPGGRAEARDSERTTVSCFSVST